MAFSNACATCGSKMVTEPRTRFWRALCLGLLLQLAPMAGAWAQNSGSTASIDLGNLLKEIVESTGIETSDEYTDASGNVVISASGERMTAEGNEAAQAFWDWLFSDAGQALIAEAGYDLEP